MVRFGAATTDIFSSFHSGVDVMNSRNTAICLLLCSSSLTAAETPDFSRQILPVLSENCFQCHGPDAEQREAGLALHEQSAAMKVIREGDRSASELYARITSSDPDTVMPPPDSGLELTAEERELIGSWIDDGAEWSRHWSWEPITRPAVPPISSQNSAGVRNPIDAFVQNKLLQTPLQVSAEADRRTLIRRLSLDLRGLPPAPSEVTEFLNDVSPQAYENLVDRFLMQSSFGERIAWDWLDAARYADSNGYQGDQERTMWPWRDWVVEAFNQNLNFNEFTRWQLAGDLLPEAGYEQKLATGFCRNHMINGEGGRIAEENRVDYVMDMAETTGTVWLGLTLNCCRCHDHKFDSLSQEDYYKFYAFFNQTPVNGGGGSGQTAPVLDAPGADQQQQIEQYQQRLSDLAEQIRSREAALSSLQSQWESDRRAELTLPQQWTPLQADQLRATYQQLEQSSDGVILASGPNPANDTYTILVTPQVSRIAAFRLEALKHKSHTNGGLARSDSGNFVLTEFEVSVVREGQDQAVPLAQGEATYEQGNLKIINVFDGDPRSGWAVHEGRPVDREHAAVLRTKGVLELMPGDQLRIVLRHDSVHVSHNLGRFRLLTSSRPDASLNQDSQQQILAALKTRVEDRTAEQTARLRTAQQSEDADWKKLTEERKQIEGKLAAVRKAVPKVMVMQDQADRRETFILDRGLYNAPGQSVTAGTPSSLPPLTADSEPTRLQLANWLMDPRNPLTARVLANRYWQMLFGQGLVKTPSDFGVQGEIPLHEDLLDWLACEFRDSNWDLKSLIRTIVTSHTYRQSSARTPLQMEHDPDNRLLSRAPRYRLPSWMLRDQALAASGLLSERIGGPPVNVYQPEGVWEDATFGRKTYSQDHGDSLYRRSLYVFWRRIIGPTIFFDNAPRQTCSVDVFRTNSPLHALQLFNDVTYVEAARVLAEGVLAEPNKTDRDRLDLIFQRLLCRPAGDAEAEVLMQGLQRSRRLFAEDQQQAVQFVSAGEAKVSDQPVTEHAAWSALCLAVLNFDETLTRE